MRAEQAYRLLAEAEYVPASFSGASGCYFGANALLNNDLVVTTPRRYYARGRLQCPETRQNSNIVGQSYVPFFTVKGYN